MNHEHEESGQVDRDWLRASLDGPDAAEPSADLWPRILRSHQRRRRVRRLRRGALAGVALAAVIVLPGLWPTKDSPLQAPVAAWQSAPASAELGRIELRSIDRQLDAAYARQDDVRVEHLWRRREFLLQTLMENPDAPESTVISL